MDKEKAKLAAQEKAFLLQSQIMDNSRNINDYYRGFESWVDEMNSKDKIISNIKSQNQKKNRLLMKMQNLN